MTTKQEFITILKAGFPTLRVGDEGKGYKPLSTAEYDAKISEWADNKVKEETDASAQIALEAQWLKDKNSGEAKLLAVGLTAAEIKAIKK